VNLYQRARHRISCVHFKEYSSPRRLLPSGQLIIIFSPRSQSVIQSVSQSVCLSVVLHSCSLRFLALSEHTQWETVKFDEDIVSRPQKGKQFLATTVAGGDTLITSDRKGVVDGSGVCSS
jgi:hypothetical protein